MADKTPKLASRSHEGLIARCDELIKAGQIRTAAGVVAKLNLARVPRRSRQALAKICRRIGLMDHGLRLLHPIIRNDKPLAEPANAGEICEYAVLLSRKGSIAEALTLLSGVRESDAPEAMLYQGFCHISDWNYVQATPHLEKFLASSADEYSKLIARVNLGSAYLSTGNLDEAETLLSATIELAQQAGAGRLAGNCLELRGQVHLLRRDFARSKADLEKAFAIFGQSGTYDQLLIHKWQAVTKGLEQDSVAPILSFRQEALAKKHWESVREADLFTLKIRFEQRLFDHLYFGTPKQAYRDRIREQLAHDPSEAFLLGDSQGLRLDLGSGEFSGAVGLNPGKKIHQALGILVRDFYAPQNLGSLFADLYPQEYFDINSSPQRVWQVLRRVRRWLESRALPASIQQSTSGYSFQIRAGFGISIPCDLPRLETRSLHLRELSAAFSEAQLFTAAEACHATGLSRAHFLRLAEAALRAGTLEKSGVGKATRYKLKSTPKAA